MTATRQDDPETRHDFVDFPRVLTALDVYKATSYHYYLYLHHHHQHYYYYYYILLLLLLQ